MTSVIGAQRWSDVALEFNPNNQSYHPVVAPLPATDPGATFGSSQQTASQLTNGWKPGMLAEVSAHRDRRNVPDELPRYGELQQIAGRNTQSKAVAANLPAMLCLTSESVAVRLTFSREF